jgi:hypothetical protein
MNRRRALGGEIREGTIKSAGDKRGVGELKGRLLIRFRAVEKA